MVNFSLKSEKDENKNQKEGLRKDDYKYKKDEKLKEKSNSYERRNKNYSKDRKNQSLKIRGDDDIQKQRNRDRDRDDKNEDRRRNREREENYFRRKYNDEDNEGRHIGKKYERSRSRSRTLSRKTSPNERRKENLIESNNQKSLICLERDKHREEEEGEVKKVNVKGRGSSRFNQDDSSLFGWASENYQEINKRLKNYAKSYKKLHFKQQKEKEKELILKVNIS